MNGFAIQAFSKRLDKEEIAVTTYAILNKIPYKLCRRFDDVPEGFIPCGKVEWCDQFLPKEKTIPNYYPDFLKDYLYRKVWFAEKWPLGQKVFIKPGDRHKRFTGFISSTTYRRKIAGPFWCSDIVKFVNEWRYYVTSGKVVASEWYFGDEINTPDAPVLNIEIPADYCGALDFGILSTGEFALVEANAPYACGWYGKVDEKSHVYVEWLIKGWENLTN
jgi:ATP-grasp domain, R2K clade family 3